MEDTESKTVLGVQIPILVVLSSFVLGGLVFAINYLTNRLGRFTRNIDTTKNANKTLPDLKEIDNQSASHSRLFIPGSNKRAKNKKRREAQQEFTHSWMIGALKGHSAPVLDMDFASNGKFLASCAEDCGLVPDLGDGRGRVVNNVQPRKADSEKANAIPKTNNDDRTTVNRRQRKTRTRGPRDQQRKCDNVCYDGMRSGYRYDDGRNSWPTLNESPVTSCNSVRWSSTSSQKEVHQNRTTKDDNGGGGGSSSSSSSSSSNSSRSSNSAENSETLRQLQYVGTQYRCLRSEFASLSDAALSHILHKYTLSGVDLAHMGYAFVSSDLPNYVIMYNAGFPSYNYVRHPLNANAREFVPRKYKSSRSDDSEGDSGHGTGSSVENSDQEQESSSDTDKCSVDSAYSDPTADKYPAADNSVNVERTCARCSKYYYVDRLSGEYLNHETCNYHLGKLRNGDRGCRIWECCKGHQNSRGCMTAERHVWTGIVVGYNGPFDGFVHTWPREVPPADGNFGVYALDCEMCFTKYGFELAKITVVGIDGQVVYDTFVRAENEVIDFNTPLCGITPHDVTNAPKTLKEVQKDLLSFISAETILIGHGLSSDLRVLRILHPTVVDTSIIFPHSLGFPFRYSLKTLARSMLHREIQTEIHDSAEDARTALDLALRRIQYDI